MRDGPIWKLPIQYSMATYDPEKHTASTACSKLSAEHNKRETTKHADDDDNNNNNNNDIVKERYDLDTANQQSLQYECSL